MQNLNPCPTQKIVLYTEKRDFNPLSQFRGLWSLVGAIKCQKISARVPCSVVPCSVVPLAAGGSVFSLHGVSCLLLRVRHISIVGRGGGRVRHFVRGGVGFSAVGGAMLCVARFFVLWEVVFSVWRLGGRVSTEFRRHGIPRNFLTSEVISARFRRGSAKVRGVPRSFAGIEPEITSVFRGMPKCHFRGHPTRGLGVVVGGWGGGPLSARTGGWGRTSVVGDNVSDFSIQFVS